MTSSERTFIYTERASGRVLIVKPSPSVDFTLNSPDFITHEIRSPSRFPRDSILNWVYDPVSGLREAAAPTPAENEHLIVLRRKIEVLLLLKFHLAIVKRDIGFAFADKKISAFPVKPENFAILWKFMRTERRLLLRKLRNFFDEFQHSIDEARDLESVQQAYHQLTVSKSVSFFSAVAKQRVTNELANN